jgi:metallo-beta-lactamase class B
MARVAARDRGVQPDPLVDTGACKRFAARSSRDFDAVLAKERAAH